MRFHILLHKSEMLQDSRVVANMQVSVLRFHNKFGCACYPACRTETVAFLILLQECQGGIRSPVGYLQYCPSFVLDAMASLSFPW